jgi:hypothetical protein
MHLKINLSSSFDSLLEVFVCGVHAAHHSYVWFPCGCTFSIAKSKGSPNQIEWENPHAQKDALSEKGILV